MRHISSVAALALLVLLASCGTSAAVFTWRVTENLNEMSSGMVLGSLITGFLLVLALSPFMLVLMRSREADRQEFMAMLASKREPPMNISLEPTYHALTGDKEPSFAAWNPQVEFLNNEFD